ncbi:MAG: isoprenoid biosynthesis glyoxalase ElbB [Calditerrivibrio sp.]|nr:isoprenoid biosynthesis glyoxalase ElbB [Calditerrivibrio sp.]
MTKKKVAVVLSGCGVYDGSEIHEAVLTMYFLDKYGAELVMFAPDVNQYHVIDHLTGEESKGETRNVLVESARIARGKINSLRDFNINDVEAVVFPGGFGAAKNLTTFAFDGADCKINEDVKRVVSDTVKARKPLAAVCIAPVILAKALEGSQINPKLTIGNDEGVAGAIKKFGGDHINCPVKEAVVDKENKIITTPAYMLGKSISEIALGIEEMVKNIFELLK